MSDHTPLVDVIKLRLKKIKRKTKLFFNMTALKDPSVKQKVGVKINEQINQKIYVAYVAFIPSLNCLKSTSSVVSSKTK